MDFERERLQHRLREIEKSIEWLELRINYTEDLLTKWLNSAKHYTKSAVEKELAKLEEQLRKDLTEEFIEQFKQLSELSE